jgi:hypothetical protein
VGFGHQEGKMSHQGTKAFDQGVSGSEAIWRALAWAGARRMTGNQISLADLLLEFLRAAEKVRSPETPNLFLAEAERRWYETAREQDNGVESPVLSPK